MDNLNCLFFFFFGGSYVAEEGQVHHLLCPTTTRHANGGADTYTKVFVRLLMDGVGQRKGQRLLLRLRSGLGLILFHLALILQ